jgi:hypothetical protein
MIYQVVVHISIIMFLAVRSVVFIPAATSSSFSLSGVLPCLGWVVVGVVLLEAGTYCCWCLLLS